MKYKGTFHIARIAVICLALALLLLCAYAAEPEPTPLARFNTQAETAFVYEHFVTREEFCVAVSKIFLNPHNGEVALPFADIEEIKAEALPYLAALHAAGILQGVQDGEAVYMRPHQQITRQEAVTLLGRIFQQSASSALLFTDEATIEPYARPYIAWFVENGIITGYPDNSFRPTVHMNAGELAYLTIRAMDYTPTGGNLTTLAGVGGHGHIDGNVRDASFSLPYGILCDKNGKLLVFDTYNNAIRSISAGAVATVTGRTEQRDDHGFAMGYYVDAAQGKALLNRPTDGVYSTSGILYFADSANSVIRFIRDNTVYTFCGTTAGYQDGVRTAAQFNTPTALAIDKQNNLYIADTLNHCIRKVDANGNVFTIAGTPQQEGHQDGAAANARFRAPAGIAVSEDGRVIYVADTGNHCIRKIEDGQVTSVTAMTGLHDDGAPMGGYRNGAASAAFFNLPRGMTLADGVLIIADSGNHMIRAITKAEQVITLAGNGEPGDAEGESLGATLASPSGVSFASGGTLYIADTGNNKIKRMDFDAKRDE